MTFRTYTLTPIDTWFFRDGRPYNQGESNLSDIKSLFPPFAMTVVGAIRASLARGLGWSGKGDWPNKIKTKLGDGQDLKPLRFKGPYLVRQYEDKQEALFPAPLHMLGKASETKEGEWEQITLLQPGNEVDCDIGDKVRLPTSNNAIGLKSLFGCYLTCSDLETVLAGGDLSEVRPIDGKDLYNHEFVVGIERKPETRTVVEGALYSISRIRLKSGICLAMEVDGIEDGMDIKSPLPFGGEGRMAYVDRLAESIDLPQSSKINPSENKVQFTVTHLTPAYFEGSWPGPGGMLPDVPGIKVVSACIERPARIGGWSTLDKKPLPLKPFLPGGSIWFCEAECECAEMINGLNGQQIGKYREYGFGEIAIGLWNDNKEGF